MSALSANDPPRPSLRERKKIKTRAAIQRHALRLFRKRGYDHTTVEDIAEAAEVSPSTFFRYFATKEDVVVYDVFDPVIIEKFKAQPPQLTPIQALRSAMRAVFTKLTPEEADEMRERADLMRDVPELRTRMLDDLLRTLQELAELVAERVGRPADDFAVRTFVGAVMGVVMAAVFAAFDKPNPDYPALMDAAFAQLEAGLPL